MVTEVPQNNSKFTPPVKAAPPSDSEEKKTAAKAPEKEPEPACPLGNCCDYDNTLYCTCKKTDTCPKGLKNIIVLNPMAKGSDKQMTCNYLIF